MNILDTGKIVLESFNLGFNKVEIKVEDYKNNTHIITIHEDQDANRKLLTMANLIQDGHTVISISSTCE